MEQQARSHGFISGADGALAGPGIAQCQARCFLPALLAEVSWREAMAAQSPAHQSDTGKWLMVKSWECELCPGCAPRPVPTSLSLPLLHTFRLSPRDQHGGHDCPELLIPCAFQEIWALHCEAAGTRQTFSQREAEEQRLIHQLPVTQQTSHLLNLQLMKHPDCRWRNENIAACPTFSWPRMWKTLDKYISK